MFDQLMFYVLMAMFASLLIIMGVWAWAETGGAAACVSDTRSRRRLSRNRTKNLWRSSWRWFATICPKRRARLLKRQGVR